MLRQLKGPAGLRFSEASLLGSHLGHLLPCLFSVSVPASVSHRSTGPAGFGPRGITSFPFTYLFKSPVSKDGHIQGEGLRVNLRVRGAPWAHDECDRSSVLRGLQVAGCPLDVLPLPSSCHDRVEGHQWG